VVLVICRVWVTITVIGPRVSVSVVFNTTTMAVSAIEFASPPAISVLNSMIQPVYGLILVTSTYTIRVQPNTHYTGSIRYGPVYGPVYGPY
jgi:hypothetical protein